MHTYTEKDGGEENERKRKMERKQNIKRRASVVRVSNLVTGQTTCQDWTGGLLLHLAMDF